MLTKYCIFLFISKHTNIAENEISTTQQYDYRYLELLAPPSE